MSEALRGSKMTAQTMPIEPLARRWGSPLCFLGPSAFRFAQGHCCSTAKRQQKRTIKAEMCFEISDIHLALPRTIPKDCRGRACPCSRAGLALRRLPARCRQGTASRTPTLGREKDIGLLLPSVFFGVYVAEAVESTENERPKPESHVESARCILRYASYYPQGLLPRPLARKVTFAE